MDCKAFKELVPALALDALDESERAACAAHLADGGPHDGCQQAEADARALVAQLAGALPVRGVDPRVWRAIEDGARAELAARLTKNGRPLPPRWRELTGWGIAVTMLSFYLVQRPLTETPRVEAAPGLPPVCQRAAALMMNPETQRYFFRAAPTQPAPARGALLLAPGEHRAVVLVDRVAPQPAGRRLHLWAVRQRGGTPALLAGFGAPGRVETSPLESTEIGSVLFEPKLPDELWLSSDANDARAPGTVLLTASLAN